MLVIVTRQRTNRILTLSLTLSFTALSPLLSVSHLSLHKIHARQSAIGQRYQPHTFDAVAEDADGQDSTMTMR